MYRILVKTIFLGKIKLLQSANNLDFGREAIIASQVYKVLVGTSRTSEPWVVLSHKLWWHPLESPNTSCRPEQERFCLDPRICLPLVVLLVMFANAKLQTTAL